MSSRAVRVGASADTVRSGRLATSPTGVSAGRSAASTRLRRSRSVTMPSGAAAPPPPPSPSPTTSSELTRSSHIRRAASATLVAAATSTGGRVTSVSTATAMSPDSDSWLLAVELRSRSARPVTKKSAKRGSSISLWNTGPGRRSSTLSSSATTSAWGWLPESSDGNPNGSPSSSTCSTRPSRSSRTAPLRTTHRYLLGSSPRRSSAWPRGT